MLDIFVYDRSYLPNKFFIYTLNRFLTYLFYHKLKGNKKRAKILKWISKYVPLPLVYDSSLVNNRKKMKAGAFYFKESEISTLLKVKFEDMETYIPVGYDAFLKRQYGDYMNDNRPRQHGTDLPNPFSPCNHREILHWNDRNIMSVK